MLKPIIFGKLCLLERISVGGMAEVYRAKPFDEPEFERFLAVKRILPNLAEESEFVQMFVDEAKIAIRLNHPNIVKMYELGRLAGSHYLVMEYISGQDVLTIQRRFRRHRKVMAIGQALFITSCLARALHHAHSHTDDEGEPLGIVHRDVSPQNVLISYAGEVKLIDFGIAKVATQTHETAAGVLKGKFSYMSPEQVRGKQVDGRSDLFALGSVFYEMLTGRRLFRGESDFHTLEQVREARVPPPSKYNSRIPVELDDIVLRMLARQRAARYDDGAAVAAALDKFMEDAGATYDAEVLSDWMVTNFAKELEAERQQRELFAKLVTLEDVRKHNARAVSQMLEAVGAPEVDVGEPLLDDREITQVEAPDYDNLVAEYQAAGLGTGGQGEVIAENVEQPLPTLIAEVRDHRLPAIDLPEPKEPEHAAELFRPHRKGTGSLAIWFPLLLVLAAGAAVGLNQLRQGMRGPTVSTGILELDISPAQGLLVFLDGTLVSTSAPAVFQDTPPGTHAVEIRHPDHEAFHTSLDIAEGRRARLEVDLTPLAPGWGLLEVDVDHPGAEIWVDGERVALDEEPQDEGTEGPGGSTTAESDDAVSADREDPGTGVPEDRETSDSSALLRLSSRDRHLVEVRAPGHLVAEHEVTLEAGEERTLAVELQPISARIELHSQPPGLAILDDVELGSTEGGLTVQDLDPMVPHRLQIAPEQPGFHPYQSTIVFEALRDVRRSARLRRLGEPVPPPEPSVGYLAIDAGEPWYRVLVEGLDTGLTTPIAVDSPLALTAGDRLITLKRGQREQRLVVSIRGDELTRVDCTSGEWDCGEPDPGP